jgi:predicted restriction endonuclease
VNEFCRPYSLFPNHHVLFDHGGVAIGEDLSLDGVEGDYTSTRNIRLERTTYVTGGTVTVPMISRGFRYYLV